MRAAQEGDVWESGIVDASDDLEFELRGEARGGVGNSGWVGEPR